MPCVLQLQSSQLQVTDSALCHELDLRNIKNTHSFKWSVQASNQAIKQSSNQANIRTHVHNEVMLAWGSFRLAPITTQLSNPCSDVYVHIYVCKITRECMPISVTLIGN